jgi:RimJ/RimL family protein N-acetyltransferase
VTVEQLETERLVLEPLAVSHAALLYPHLRDSTLYEFLDDDPPVSVAILEERYDRWSAGRSPDGREVWLNWAARLRGTEDYVGWFQATVRSRDADIAYLVFAPHQRRGYAREACRAVMAHLTATYDVARVGVTADRHNAASIQLAQSLGFTPAGSHRDEVMFTLQVTRHPASRTGDSSE